jgi:hypothetical protein
MDLILPQSMETDETDEVDIIEEPCSVVDDEDEDDQKCPICTHNAGEASCIQKMNEIEESLTGTVSPEEIYRIQYQMYDHQVKKPLERQGMKVPEISIANIRNHYQNHRMNMHMIISKEILFVNEMQRQMRKSQIAVKNIRTGKKRLLLKEMDQWQKLSKHKLDLIKYYNGPLAKKAKGNASGIKPYEFG